MPPAENLIGAETEFFGISLARYRKPFDRDAIDTIETRREFETRYTADRNYLLLMELYRRACAARSCGFTEVLS